MNKVKTNNEKQFINIASNARFDLVRNETLEDENYIVVPVVMIVEGVLNGSAGPILYVKDEIASVPASWAKKPIVVNHPSGETATTKEYLDSSGIGIIMNASTDSNGRNGLTRLKSEAWLKESRLKKVDERILNAINKREMVEVSTGLWFQFEATEGEFNGIKYNGIARNILPDHLAILPDSIGASSIADGAGLVRNEAKDKYEGSMIKFSALANEMSSDSIRDEINTLLRNKLDTSNDKWVWVDAVYAASGFVIYEYNGKLFKQRYSDANDVVELIDEPEPVVRIVEYRTVEGAFVGNSTTQNKEEKTNMEKSKIVDALIANRGWSEDDRESLMGADEKILNALNADPEKVEVEKVVEIEKVKAINSRDELLEAIQDAGLKAQVQNGFAKLDAEKDALVKKIFAAENNAFSEDELNAESLERLNKIAALVVKTKNANYAGNADPAFSENKTDDSVPVLELPK